MLQTNQFIDESVGEAIDHIGFALDSLEEAQAAAEEKSFLAIHNEISKDLNKLKEVFDHMTGGGIYGRGESAQEHKPHPETE